MAATLQQLSPTLPITALSFLPSTHISESILLAGEGSICKIYSPATGQLLHTRRIFQREAINGINFLEQDDPSETSSTQTIRREKRILDDDESEHSEDEGIEGGNRKIVFWGGHRILVTTLAELIADSPQASAAASLTAELDAGVGGNGLNWSQYHQHQQLPEVPVKDWVHYAFFIPRPGGALVAVVTSHNQLLVYDQLARKWIAEVEIGEKCILYSATGLYIPPEEEEERNPGSGGRGRIVVAAGTVFGDILVWSTPITVESPKASTVTIAGGEFAPHLRKSSALAGTEDSWTEVSDDPEGWDELSRSTASVVSDDMPGTPKLQGEKSRERSVELHYRLKGHEGSIFGVHMSPSFTLLQGGPDGKRVRKRYLASCSDDRTVRMWDISRVDADEEEGEEEESDLDLDGQRLSTVWDKVQIEEVNTGFGHTSNSTTEDSSNTNTSKDGGAAGKHCVSIGWGHAARIWNTRILSNLTQDGSIHIISTSEDLTSKMWKFEPLKPAVGNLKILESTHLHSGKNVFAMAVDERWGMLATGGHDSRIAVVAYGGMGVERSDWELTEVVGHEMDVLEHSLGGLQISNCDPAKALGPTRLRKPIPDTFRNYAVVDKEKFLVTTNKGWLATYTFPGRAWTGAVSGEGVWKNLGRWQNLEGITAVVAWEGTGLVAVQDRFGMVGILDVGALESEGPISGEEKRGRWWRAGEPNPGPLFCSRHGDLYYLLTTSLVDAEVRLHLFPDPRVSAPGVRNADTPPPHIKTIILLPLPSFQSVTSFYLDFANGLLFLGGRTGVLCAFDVWSGVDANIMLSPLDTWRGWHDKDAITCIIAYPANPASTSPQKGNYDDQQSSRFPQTPRLSSPAMDAGKQRVSRIVTAGRNGVYAILEASLSPLTSRVHLTKLHVKRILNNGLIEGLYFRGRDLLCFGFRGKSFFVWNETRGYEVLSEECGGAHRSWAFYKAGEMGEEAGGVGVAGGRGGGGMGGGTGWFVRTQAGRCSVVRTDRPVRRVLRVGGHGREIKALAISPENIDTQYPRLIATGAEDTVIRLSILRSQRTEKGKVEQAITGVSVFKKHSTGIQHLAWSDCGGWLFSSGGVEEFYVWRVRRLDAPNRNASSSLGRNVGVVCEAECPVQSIVPDLRIMGFDVTTIGIGGSEMGGGDEGKAFLITMVYSDSSIKLWLYDPQRAFFRLIVAGRYRTSCLLHVHHYIHRRTLTPQSQFAPSNTDGAHGGHDSAMLIFIAGTDGHVTVYDITRTLRKAGISILPDTNTTSIHQTYNHNNNQTSANRTIAGPSPILVSRPGLLTSAPPPVQLLSPPKEGWSYQIHQSSIKSMRVLPLLDVRRSDSPQEGISVLVLTGGDDTALAATVLTLSPDTSTNGLFSSSNYPPTLYRSGSSDPSSGGEYLSVPPTPQDIPIWKHKAFPEAHASAITSLCVLWTGKPRWTGDVDDEPVKEVTARILTAGVDRVISLWDVSVLMSAGGVGDGMVIGDEGRGNGRGRVVGVKLKEVAGGRRYTPIADVACAEVVGRKEGGEGDGRARRVIVVGVGMDLWDVVEE